MSASKNWRIGAGLGHIVRGKNYLKAVAQYPHLTPSTRQMVRQATDLLKAAENEMRKELKK